MFATIPNWILTDAAPLVTMLAKPLPRGTAGTVNLIRWTTEPVADVQNGMNGALATPTIAEGTAGLTIRTVGVRAKMSVQLAEMGRAAVDAQLLPAMVAAVDAQIDNQVINGGGTNGEVTGMRSTSNISTGTYTDAGPTVVEAWPIVEGTVRDVELGMGGAPILVMHPRRPASRCPAFALSSDRRGRASSGGAGGRRREARRARGRRR